MPVNKAEIRRCIESIQRNREHFNFRRCLGVMYRKPGVSGQVVLSVNRIILEEQGIDTKDFLEQGLLIRENACGTTCCIAGDIVIRNGDEYDRQYVREEGGLGMLTFATEKLGIDYDTSNTLFTFACDKATADDAIARLAWILNHGNLDKYRTDSESWSDE